MGVHLQGQSSSGSREVRVTGKVDSEKKVGTLVGHEEKGAGFLPPTC